MRIEHIAFNVAHPKQMAQWYVDHLGFTIVRAEDQSPYIHFLADSAGQGILEIYNNPAADVPDYANTSPLIVHIALLVDEMAAERNRLLAAGATAVGEISETPAGDQLAFLRDPWGMPLQLVKRHKPLL